MTFIIAIDGPSGAGKGTLGRALAQYYNLASLDTGLLYRYVGIKALRSGISLDQEEALAQIARDVTFDDLNDFDLRTHEASNSSSKVAVFHKVREALFIFQRKFAFSPPQGFSGSLLDGRDIGTVVCPEATAKIYLTAQPEIRAERRFKELQERKIQSIYSVVLKDMKERDLRDIERTESPLKPAFDALEIDTSFFTPEDLLKKAIAFIEMRRSCS